MKATSGLVVWFLLSIFGAHALAFALVGALPNPAIVALGVHSGQKGARTTFEQENKTRTYVEAITDIGRGYFGKTLDGVPVSGEVGAAIRASAPRFFVAVLVMVMIVVAFAMMPLSILQPLGYASSLLSFFPPFFAPFVGLGILVSTNAVFDLASEWGGWVLCSLCLAFPSAALVAAQTAEVMNRNLRRPFAMTVRAMGGSRIQQRIRLLNNLWMELTPTFEKLVTGLLTTSLFAEPIFAESGLGATTLRAIRRTDVDLILALVLLFALIVNLARVTSNSVRMSYGLPAR
jgi:ABC-type dipeptide/oligopeptide/nickel transport system permease component